MKKILYLSLILLTIHVAQAQTTTPPAGAKAAASRDDDTMMLTLTDTPEASWRRLSEVLVQRGYSIEHSSKDLLTLSTYPLHKSRLGMNRVAGTVINGVLIVRLYWGASADTGGGTPILVRRKQSDKWVELVGIGQALGGSASYSTAVPD